MTKETKAYRDGYRQDTEGWQKLTEMDKGRQKLTEMDMDIDRHRGMTKDYRDGYRQTQRDDKSLQRWI